MLYLLVFAGGGTGSLLRFIISKSMAAKYPLFPWGTLLANTIGTFLIGLLSIWLIDRNLLASPLREMILVGFLGGLTTFSSFSYESHTLLHAGRYSELGLYLAGNLIGGYILLIGGRVLGRV